VRARGVDTCPTTRDQQFAPKGAPPRAGGLDLVEARSGFASGVGKASWPVVWGLRPTKDYENWTFGPLFVFNGLDRVFNPVPGFFSSLAC